MGFCALIMLYVSRNGNRARPPPYSTSVGMALSHNQVIRSIGNGRRGNSEGKWEYGGLWLLINCITIEQGWRFSIHNSLIIRGFSHVMVSIAILSTHLLLKARCCLAGPQSRPGGVECVSVPEERRRLFPIPNRHSTASRRSFQSSTEGIGVRTLLIRPHKETFHLYKSRHQSTFLRPFEKAQQGLQEVRLQLQWKTGLYLDW